MERGRQEEGREIRDRQEWGWGGGRGVREGRDRGG